MLGLAGLALAAEPPGGVKGDSPMFATMPRMVPAKIGTVPRPAASVGLSAQTRDKDGRTVARTITIVPAKTAVIVIDMWDRHWCRTFTARVGSLVPRLNATLEACRKLGVQVVMAPSDVVEYYKEAPQRKAMLAIPQHPEPKTIRFDPPGPPKPIDHCECGPRQPCPKGTVWTRQHPGVKIAPADLIADCNNGRELLNLCQERGIDTLLYTGVASNMCVLNRSCGILNMKRHGLRVIVVGDIVEAMTANGIGADERPDRNFTPAKGSAMVLPYIEQRIAPSIRSRQLIAAAGLGPADKRPQIVFVAAEKEYDSSKTLPAFAKKYLETDFRCTYLNATGPEEIGTDDIPGLEALDDADLLVLSARRRALPVVQMDHLEKFIRAGRPMVALRTSAVAFQTNSAPRPGCVVWNRFDKEVLGCNYQGYNPKSRQTGCDVWIAPDAAGHPILRGVAATFHSPCWIYRQRPLADTTHTLLMGRWSKQDPDEPVAWTNTYQGGRIFYTTLGHPGDFQIEAFNRLLRNAIYWALGLPTGKH
jgi:nicotinamidase-related amidase